MRLLPTSLAAAALLVAPAAASAAPDWVAPTGTGLTSPLGLAPHVGIAGDGTRTRARIEVESVTPPHTHVVVDALAVGAAGREELRVSSTPAALPIEVDLAVAPSGAAVVAWLESTPGTDATRVRAAYRPAGASTWEAPHQVAAYAGEGPTGLTTIEAAISADGTAAVGVNGLEADGVPEPAPKQTDAAFSLAVHDAKGWLATTVVSTPDQSSASAQLAFDAHGDLTTAWTQRYTEGKTASVTDDRFAVMTRRRSRSTGVLGAPQPLSGEGDDAASSVLGVGPDGHAVVAWQTATGSQFGIRAALRGGPAAAWTAAPGLALSPEVVGNNLPYAAAVGADGVAYVAGVRTNPSTGAACVALWRAVQGGGFTGACASPAGLLPEDARLVAVGDDAHAVFITRVPLSTQSFVQATRWRREASAPDGFQDVDDSESGVRLVDLIADAGGVAAFWLRGPDVRQAAFDAGAPLVRDFAVPASAVAGVPVTLSASAVDAWSALEAPRWDFGDGTAGEGAAVTHAFPAGVHTVTARVRDARGNETVRTATITVAAPPATPGPPPATTPAPPAPPAVACVVPKVRRGVSLPAARRALTQGHCGVRVVKQRSKTVRKGRVIRVKATAGSRRAANARVTVLVSRGRR
jgi:hypothetical protein